MKKKIAHVIIGLHIGGAELMLQRLVLNSSKKKKFKHIIISLTDLGTIGPQLIDKGIEVYCLNMNSAWSTPYTFFKLRSLLKKVNPDVVQTWMYHSDFLGGLAAKSLGIDNIIWGVRTTDVSKGDSKVTIQLTKICSILSYIVPQSIICAAYASMDYHKSIGYDKSKLMVIPNGFDFDNLNSSVADGLKIRKDIDLKDSDIVIGSIGRFDPVKNQKLFIEVASILNKIAPDLKFIMIGKDNSYSNKELMNWIDSFGLKDNFKLLGHRNDVSKCLKAIDILCIHSNTEGFPNIIVESIFAKTYVVSCDVGDVNKLLGKDQITTNNKVQLAETILKHIKNKNYLNNTILSSLRDSVVEKYSIDKIVLEFEKVYEDSQI